MARTNKLTTVHFPAIRWNGPTQPLDDEHRWNTARRLLHDDTLKPEDRLAGQLLLLYAQGPSAIHRLTTEDVEVGAQEVRLHLGNAPIQLPEPVAQLARTVAAKRKGHATIGALAPPASTLKRHLHRQPPRSRVAGPASRPPLTWPSWPGR
ncbi:hypothetical protein ABZ876_30275 [Streptomyces sp. NPDC046931]|uniref:hypothetical protein n=1 Tax=Streptomyces sp. NPDC046931 TaxID=3154806 RepID=UPI0033E7CED0